jgi:hypothetical protein
MEVRMGLCTMSSNRPARRGSGRSPPKDVRFWFLLAAGICAPLAVQAQSLAPNPMTLEQIAARSGKPLSRDDVLKFVSRAKVQWSVFAGGERLWTNEPGGSFYASRIGTGVGSFNPHRKSGRGEWRVQDDGQYCVKIDYGMLMIEGWCWQFFEAGDGEWLMHLTPEGPSTNSARIEFKH